jgi:hypothetical protein
MLISHRHKLLFVHVAKNAGTSITHALRPLAGGELRRKIGRILRRHGIITRLDASPYPAHSTAAELRRLLGPARYARYFSFAIVRNPWDRHVSFFHYIRRDSTHHQHALFQEFPDFTAYARWRIDNPNRLQRTLVCDDEGRLLVNFIGRYENLAADFSTVCGRVGATIDLPRKNVSNDRPYREFYNAESRDLIARATAPDIELFGYEF